MPDSSFTGFAVFDIETTGLSPSKHHRVIELGIVRLDEDLEVVEVWETLINPHRDIGAGEIHGLTASDLVNAPSFEDLLADIWHRFEGAIPVAHNFSFDQRFIISEFHRNGVDIDFDGLCTLQLANSLGLAPGRRRLCDLCKCLSIDTSESHSAGNDARMCAEVLRHMADQFDLAAMKQPVSCRELWKRKATPLGITRQKARDTPIQSPLQLLFERLGNIANESSTDDSSLNEYLAILERVLEDRVIEESEANELAVFASEKGFTPEDIEKVHYRFVASLVALVLSDGIVTDDERRDLTRVAGLLGIDTVTVERLLHENPERERFSDETLVGTTVCFTGKSSCYIDGELIDQTRAESLAEFAGLIPKSTVTKKLDLLVVADPDTESGKAKKARQYGIRIIAERAFWQKLGIQAD